MYDKFLFGFLILVTVGLNTIAQMLLKLGSGHGYLNIYLFGGLLAYSMSTVFYIAVLGKFNLSIAYPVVIGLTVGAATIAGVAILKEKVPIGHWVGIGLMLAGISAIVFAKRS